MVIVDSVETIVRDKYGNIKSKHVYPNNYGLLRKLLVKLGLRHNSIVKAGMEAVAGLILTDVGGTAFDYVAFGSNNTAVTVNDTALGTEIKRKAGTGTKVTTTYTNDTAQLTATFSSADGLTGTSTVWECGMFNDATAGTMLFRQVYSAADTLNWDAGDTYQLILKVVIKQG
jgi:hypothetical protein